MIKDNYDFLELRQQVKFYGVLFFIFRIIPFSHKLFPKVAKAFDDFQDLKLRSLNLIDAPDKFNSVFAKQGWIAYEGLKSELMFDSISVFEQDGFDKAETFLADYYDSDLLNFHIRRFNRHPEFRKRVRLIKLAQKDYLAERYYACIPLLLALVDGLVNDISGHVVLGWWNCTD